MAFESCVPKGQKLKIMNYHVTFFFLSLLASVAAQDAPWFCHSLDCPSFTQTNTSDLQLRAYPSKLWASTQINSTSLDDAMSTGFSRLFEYISGANANSAKIDMTAPVLVKVLPGSGPNCASVFTVSFFVPFSYQSAAGPPKPTSSLVYIESIPAMDVAVNEFGGFAKQDAIIAKAAQEEQAVSASSSFTEADGEVWWYAGYDPPFRLSNRCVRSVCAVCVVRLLSPYD